MTDRNIYFVKRELKHPGIESVRGDEKGMYRVKEGYNLPVTAHKMVKNQFGYTHNKIDYFLPGNSLFWCKDMYCQEIQSMATPIMKEEYKLGDCFGTGCMDNDFETMKKKDGVATFEMSII